MATSETDAVIINTSAMVVAAVKVGQRNRIKRQTELVDILTEQLVSAVGSRDELEEAIEDETADDKTGERRARMMKAVSLSTHVATAVNLSTALKTLILLERQAFSIRDDADTVVNVLGELLKQVSGTGLPIVQDDVQG